VSGQGRKRSRRWGVCDEEICANMSSYQRESKKYNRLFWK